MKSCKESILLGILGKKWMSHIVATFALQRSISFGNLQREFPHVTSRVLSQRLKELTTFGLITFSNNKYEATEKFIHIDCILKELEKLSNK